MRLLSATCVHVPASLSGKEEIEDLAKYLDNWFDLIAIRTPSLAKMTELADRASAPVINLRTRENHPCETLGDLSYVKARRKNLDNLVVAAVAPAANIIHSWAEASEALPLSLVQIYPREYWVSRANYPRSSIEQTEDMGAGQTSSLQTVGRMGVRRRSCCRFRSLRGRSIRQKQAACSSPARRSRETRCQPMR
jgi:ornithine carbamoyltransferase